MVFRNRAGANAAMLNEVERLHKDGRPVLIGTTNVQMSDQTAKDLEERGVPCQVNFASVLPIVPPVDCPPRRSPVVVIVFSRRCRCRCCPRQHHNVETPRLPLGLLTPSEMRVSRNEHGNRDPPPPSPS